MKLVERNRVGREETILHVKGSSGDLAKIDESGFSPVRMAHLLALARLPSLSDPQMVNELRTHMTRASAPRTLRDRDTSLATPCLREVPAPIASEACSTSRSRYCEASRRRTENVTHSKCARCR